MLRPSAAVALVSTVVLLTVAGAAPASAVDGPVTGLPAAHGESPLVTSVLTAPRPVRGADKRVHLVYEILLQNPSGDAVRLDRVEVRDPHRPVAVHRGAALRRHDGVGDLR
jgi:hypothetical protein